MKACAICGRQAHRGSVCQDCRAALKRARDETVSRFQPLALAGAGGAAITDPQLRDERRRALRPVARTPASIPLPEPIEVGAARANGSRFVWAIVSLMVLAAIVVAAGVINGAIEAARSAAQTPPAPSAAPASEPAPAPAPVVAERAEPVIAPMPRETTVGVGVQDEVAARMHLAPVLPAAVVTPPAVAATRPAGRARTAVPEAPPATMEARPVAPPVAAPETASAPVRRPTATAASGATRAQPRQDRWERMAGAMQACSTEEFLGRVICEQKVRLEYCEGYWGQVAQCPGGPVNDHGQ